MNSESKEKVNDTFFVEYKAFGEVPTNLHTMIKETMFANNYPEEILSELNKCVRVMPHHQNTSGFFITVIEKIAECTNDSPVLATEDLPEP